MARGGGESALSRIYDGIGSFTKLSLGVGVIFGTPTMIALVGLVIAVLAAFIGAVVHDLPSAIATIQSMKVGAPAHKAGG